MGFFVRKFSQSQGKVGSNTGACKNMLSAGELKAKNFPPTQAQKIIIIIGNHTKKHVNKKKLGTGGSPKY